MRISVQILNQHIYCTKLSDVCYPRNNAHCALDITADDNVLLQKVIVTGTVPDKTQNTCS